MPDRHRTAARIARVARRAVATLVAVGVVGVVAFATTSPGPALAAPLTLSAAAVSHHSFQVSWAAVDRARAYVVTLATDPDFAHVAFRSGRTTSTSLVASGGWVQEDTTYYARINAVADANVSLPSPALVLRTTWQPPGAAGTPQPTKVDTSGFTVSWKAAPRAEQYRVVVASDRALTKDVQESTTVEPTAQVRVRDGRRYFVKVTPVRKGLTAPQALAQVAVPLKKLGQPGRTFAEPLSSSSLRVAWPAAKNATAYTVQLLRHPGEKARYSTTTPEPSVLIAKLNPAKHGLGAVFYVKVRATRYGKAWSSTRTVAATMLPGSTTHKTSFTAKVSSYNLLKPSKTDAEKRSWERRYAAAARALRGMDIAGLQETPWHKFDGKRPVVQVAKTAKLSVARHPGTKKPCTPNSEPILYRKSRFTVLRCGYDRLDTKGQGAKKWSTWAVLREKSSGRKVLVVNAHLLAYSSSSSTSPRPQAMRVTQARRLEASIARHNRGHYPVIVTGDLNTYPNRASVTPIDVLARGGYASAELVAAKRTGAEFASFHGFAVSRLNGKHLDHVLVDRKSQVLTYEVRHTNVKRAPSDHFQIVTNIAVH